MLRWLALLGVIIIQDSGAVSNLKFESTFNATGCVADGFTVQGGSPECDSTSPVVDGEAFRVVGGTADAIRTSAMSSVDDTICITFDFALNTIGGGSEKMIRGVDSGAAYTYPDIELKRTSRLVLHCDSNTTGEGTALSADGSYTKMEVQWNRADGSITAWEDDIEAIVIDAANCDDNPNVVEKFELNDPGTGSDHSIDNFKVENGACS
jgi:hypothetical protein